MTFEPEDIFATGTFSAGATTITGTTTIMTGINPLATHQMTWTLSRC